MDNSITIMFQGEPLNLEFHGDSTYVVFSTKYPNILARKLFQHKAKGLGIEYLNVYNDLYDTCVEVRNKARFERDYYSRNVYPNLAPELERDIKDFIGEYSSTMEGP